MITAIFPIHNISNTFWSSDRGLKCIEDFFQTYKKVSVLDRLVVITQDERVSFLARQHDLETANLPVPGSMDRPYTLEQTRSLARNFLCQCHNLQNGLLVGDHRNLLFTLKDIKKSILMYQEDPTSAVISLALCRDHPCQLKAFYSFLGCEILYFETHQSNGRRIEDIKASSDVKANRTSNMDGRIKTHASIRNSQIDLSLTQSDLFMGRFVVQILPFGQNGPWYTERREIIVSSQSFHVSFEIPTLPPEGLILIFTAPSDCNEYDTIEIFTPENASWDLGNSPSLVCGTKDNEPLRNRQKLPLTYSYDGTICIISQKHLLHDDAVNYRKILLNGVCIVTDWVDYYSAGTQNSWRVRV